MFCKRRQVEDMIDGLGIRAYRIQVDAPPPDLAALDPGNLIINPLREAHNVGTPDGSYIAQRSAPPWFVDPRTRCTGGSPSACAAARTGGSASRLFR